MYMHSGNRESIIKNRFSLGFIGLLIREGQMVFGS